MSDFLSRENDILGGEFISGSGAGPSDLDMDFERAASAFPDISLDGSVNIPTSSAAPPMNMNVSSGFSFDDFETRERITTDVKVTGDDEIEKFEDQFPDISVPQQQTFSPPSQPSFGASTPFAPRPQPSAYSATPILHHQVEEDEPQVIKDWREKQAAEIKARDDAAKAKRQETIARAERSIDEFYEDYTSKKTRNISENKEQEIEYRASLTSSLSSGTTWERICDLVELQNSQSKTIARTGPGTTDLSRFKEVLLRLKREGAAAPGAAGY